MSHQEFTPPTYSRFRPKVVSALVGATLPMVAALALAGPLSMPNPLTFGAGPVGKIDVQGIASGMAFYQDNPQGSPGSLGAKHVGADITNGMVIIQKETGPLQFYIQAGAYSYPTLAATLPSANTSTNAFGALPVAYLKYVPNSIFSVEFGKLPTLMGAEDGFTYQNINIERGLLWDMEPIISRGVQLNYSQGPLSAAVSLNDGYYSNRYNVMSGSVSYALNSSNTVGFYADGPLGNVRQPSFLTSSLYSPYGDESQLYGVTYTYNSGPWVIEPYVQYMVTPKALYLGVAKSFTNYGASLLADYSLTKTVSIAGRVEYLGVGGHPGEGDNVAASLLTDLPIDSHAWSLTVTPTYQSGGFFARAELSYVMATTPANYGGFSGSTFANTTQLRGMLETGFMF
jgi:hypothetical protein